MSYLPDIIILPRHSAIAYFYNLLYIVNYRTHIKFLIIFYFINLKFMPKKFRILMAVIAMTTMVLSGTALTSGAESGTEPIKRKIVIFKLGVHEDEKDTLIKHSRGVKEKDLDFINAKAVSLPDNNSEKELKDNPNVLRIEDDVIVEALDKEEKSLDNKRAKTNAPAQVLPWGIDRIDAELVWPGGNTADPVKVAVIDTGISKDHPDLKANIKGGINIINPLKSWNDDNGHGSHVAGIIAALNNDLGVVGAGPAADLYAVKALNRNGSGFLSDVISGIQWSVANGIKVINLSLGTSQNIQSMHDAVKAAHDVGVVVIAAAGNSGGAVIFPAAYPEVIAVGATDKNNVLASFSSRGPEVDLVAPGVSIFSTYKGTGYAILSGTSMAAPHVTGSAALALNAPVGAYDANGNGVWDPAEAQKKLQDRAVDKGASGFDNFYGWGLVNAFNAVQ